MDKYTVDLDKVLNDFEYSELTDEYSVARGRPTDSFSFTSAPHLNNVYPTAAPKVNKYDNSHVKHSITNVFHSLNEYLNTDIGPKSVQRNVDLVEDVDPGNQPVSETNTFAQSKEGCSTNVSNYHIDVYNNTLKSYNISKEQDVPLTPKVQNSDNKISLHSEPKNNLLKSVEQPQNYKVNESVESKHQTYENIISMDILSQPVEMEVDTNPNSLSYLSNLKNIHSAESAFCLVQDTVKEVGLKHDGTVLEDEVNCATPEQNIDVIVSDNTEKNIPVEDDDSNFRRENTAAIISSPENDPTVVSSESSNVDVPEAQKQNSLHFIAVKEDGPSAETDEKILGFEEHLDMDDSAINKYLDELENEYNSQNLDELQMITANTNVLDAFEQAVSQVSLNSSIETVEEVVSKPVELQQDHANAYDNTAIHDENIEIKLSSDVGPSVTVKEVLVAEETTLSDACEDAKNAEAAVAVSRPKFLGLVTDSKSKSTINLVGDPGSTPYNNVYVAKELPRPARDDLNDSDTDSSVSASPTFSDVSTESAATTESVTDSIDDRNVPHVNVDDSLRAVGDNNKEKVKDIAGGSSSMTDNNTSPNDNDLVKEPDGENLNNNNFQTTGDREGVGNTTSELQVGTNNNGDGDGPVVNDGGLGGEQLLANPQQVDVLSDENVLENPTSANVHQNNSPGDWLGKQAPLWIPDSEAVNCLHCDIKFTVIKRRHHCRACGLVLCSKCCNLKYKLEYLDAEARVCLRCCEILNKDNNSSSGSEVSPSAENSPSHQANQPNPNNPMEYCSVVPPLQQVSGSSQNPPTVMVPVGVLKRKGSAKTRTNKSVMFCDGIRPGSELTNLDNDFNYMDSKLVTTKKSPVQSALKMNKNVPLIDEETKSFIPSAENSLPPTVKVFKSDISYTECANRSGVAEMLKNETLTFAIQRNFHVQVKIVNMDCCINKLVWCFSTEGLISVGQDEIVILLEVIDNEASVPKEVFIHLNNIYMEAKKGASITELGISLHSSSIFLGSKNHAGFLYIRPTFQCLQNIIVPKEPYLIGILMHRWETPWAKIFPLRLVLRLGAEYRYYPSPIISTRHRESVFVEIGHTIINLLADFRNFSYTLPNIRGLTIHMEEKNTTVKIPSNRYDQVMKSLNNSSDHILAFGGNFSSKADSHLVCIQDVHGNNENTYTTHAINIHNVPRKVTGASFIVFNGALKSSSGLTAKSSIVEDGLMIQIPAEHMLQVRESLRNMKNHTIQCGCVNTTSDETVNIIWDDNDINFNIGVLSPIDNQPLSGIPSIRVHNGKDFICNSGNRLIRWTEVFILQNKDENTRGTEVDFSKLSENISKATCQALVKYLDLLSSNNFYKIGIRVMLHVEQVSYSAGSNGMKLPPIYMKSLDNELIPILHRITSNNLGENAIVLELIFRILNM